MIEEKHEKIPVRLVGTAIWTRDLPNASLVRYHGATSLGTPYPFCDHGSVRPGTREPRKYL